MLLNLAAHMPCDDPEKLVPPVVSRKTALLPRRAHILGGWLGKTPRLPSGRWEIWVSFQTTPPRCVHVYASLSGRVPEDRWPDLSIDLAKS